jgi:hypothetical protein
MFDDQPGHPNEGFWDDGEWVSWDWINEQLCLQDRRDEFPAARPEIVDLFDTLVDVAIEYRERTGRYLSLFGELGELYAEIKYGIQRHRPGAAGSDGKLGNDFVEIKTISPDKSKDKVFVKRTGHFSKLVVVKISAEFEFESRILDRKALQKGKGRRASVSWTSMPCEDDKRSEGN